MVVDVTTVLATTTTTKYPRLTQHFLTYGTTVRLCLRCLSIGIVIFVGLCRSQCVEYFKILFCWLYCLLCI